MISFLCLACSNAIHIQDEPFVGQHVQCETCLNELQITWLYPLTLDFMDEDRIPEIKKHLETVN